MSIELSANSVAALLQLAAKGVQNLLLDIDPEVTLFKQTYKRHTSYAVQAIAVDPTSGNQNWGSELKFTIPRQGDLIAETFFVAELPVIGPDTTKNAYYKCQTTMTNKGNYGPVNGLSDGSIVPHAQPHVTRHGHPVAIKDPADKTKSDAHAASDSHHFQPAAGSAVSHGKGVSLHSTDTKKLNSSNEQSHVSTVAEIGHQAKFTSLDAHDGNVSTLDAQTVKAQQFLTGTDHASVAYCNALGHAMISSVQLKIGGTELQTFSGQWMHLWHSYTHGDDQALADSLFMYGDGSGQPFADVAASKPHKIVEDVNILQQPGAGYKFGMYDLKIPQAQGTHDWGYTDVEHRPTDQSVLVPPGKTFEVEFGSYATTPVTAHNAHDYYSDTNGATVNGSAIRIARAKSSGQSVLPRQGSSFSENAKWITDELCTTPLTYELRVFDSSDKDVTDTEASCMMVELFMVGLDPEVILKQDHVDGSGNAPEHMTGITVTGEPDILRNMDLGLGVDKLVAIPWSEESFLRNGNPNTRTDGDGFTAANAATTYDGNQFTPRFKGADIGATIDSNPTPLKLCARLRYKQEKNGAYSGVSDHQHGGSSDAVQGYKVHVRLVTDKPNIGSSSTQFAGGFADYPAATDNTFTSSGYMEYIKDKLAGGSTKLDISDKDKGLVLAVPTEFILGGQHSTASGKKFIDSTGMSTVSAATINQQMVYVPNIKSMYSSLCGSRMAPMAFDANHGGRLMNFDEGSFARSSVAYSDCMFDRMHESIGDRASFSQHFSSFQMPGLSLDFVGGFGAQPVFGDRAAPHTYGRYRTTDAAGRFRAPVIDYDRGSATDFTAQAAKVHTNREHSTRNMVTLYGRGETTRGADREFSVSSSATTPAAETAARDSLRQSSTIVDDKPELTFTAHGTQLQKLKCFFVGTADISNGAVVYTGAAHKHQYDNFSRRCMMSQVGNCDDPAGGGRIVKVTVPLPLFYCSANQPGKAGRTMSLPIIALQYHDAEIRVRLNERHQCIQTDAEARNTSFRFSGATGFGDHTLVDGLAKAEVDDLAKFIENGVLTDAVKNGGFHRTSDTAELVSFQGHGVAAAGKTKYYGGPNGGGKPFNTAATAASASFSGNLARTDLGAHSHCLRGGSGTASAKGSSDGGIIKSYLVMNNIYLDSAERNLFATSNHEYLIMQVQEQYASAPGSKTCRFTPQQLVVNLPFNHPVFSMFWTLQRPESRWNKSHFRYEATHMGGDPLLLAWRLSMNGHGRESSVIYDQNYSSSVMAKQYWDSELPANVAHNSRDPATGGAKNIYNYNFAQTPSDWYQPTGNLNFSRLDNCSLTLFYKGHANQALFGDPRTVAGGGAHKFGDEVNCVSKVMEKAGKPLSNDDLDNIEFGALTSGVEARVYAMSYNVLRIATGMANIKYAN